MYSGTGLFVYFV